MTVLLFVVGVLVFTVGLALSVGLHELGHLIPGKLFDVKVTQYFIGFGPTVWSTRRGETEYGVKAVPFGGFVKLVGMLPPGRADGKPAAAQQGHLRVSSSTTPEPPSPTWSWSATRTGSSTSCRRGRSS